MLKAAGGDDVIVFDQHGVEQAGAVVLSAAATNGVFFKCARPGVVLRVSAILALCAGNRVGIAPRQGRDARHAAHEVERDALGGQDCAGIAGNGRDDVAGRNARAIGF